MVALGWPLRRRVRYVPQMEVTDCGAACVAMVLGYHGHHAPLPEVRRACGVSRDGAGAIELLHAAEQYGMEVTGLKVEPEQLTQLPTPAILHWDFNHFVVLERCHRRHVALVDPAVGRRRMTVRELSRHFTGVALALEPTPRLTPRRRQRPSLARYGEIARATLPSLALVLLASLGVQLAGLVLPVASQLLLDRVISPRQEVWLWGLGVALGAAVLARILLTLVRSYVIQGLQNLLDVALMARFVEHLLSLPLGFFLHRSTGDLVQRVESNTMVRNLLSSQSVSALLDGFLLAGYVALMAAYDVRLGGLVVAFGLVRVALVLALRDRNQNIMAAELAATGREIGAYVEALTGLETTKASGSEKRMAQRWTNRMVVRVNCALDRRKLALGAGQLTVLLQGLSTAAVFLVGGEEVLSQRMTLGVFASFLVLQSLFMAPLESLLVTVGQLQYLGNHLERLDDVLMTAREPSGTVDPGRLRGAIELAGVQFRYAASSPTVLQGIDVAIRPGEKVAIVGPSGAGKSTLARLLLGLYLPTGGRIAIDGQDLGDLDLVRVRSQMGIVLQEAFLSNDTVRANLSLGDPDLPLEALERAARLACIDEVIAALSDGYDTRVGENGALLSGGERQRLGLARALAREPAVLLLDEATSALDLETERRVHANLAALGCTRILIAHRLATVRDADRILVLEDGRIVQEGSYDGLASRDGLFRRLVEARELARA